ncbi:hypothetical protein P154DRAFT_525392, partial [Amniculicola lignicola CBS 123094]
MDRASQVLAEGFPSDVLRTTYAAFADRSGVPLSTRHHHAHGRCSREKQAQRQQYLTPEEEKALVKFLLLISNLGHTVRIKFIPSLAFRITRRWSLPDKPIQPPGKKWLRAFEKRYPEPKARQLRAI